MRDAWKTVTLHFPSGSIKVSGPGWVVESLAAQVNVPNDTKVSLGEEKEVELQKGVVWEKS